MFALLAFPSLFGCSAPEAEEADRAEQDSTYNGHRCDVQYSRLEIGRLAGISVEEPTPYRIDASEKIRHLNELTLLSDAMLSVMRDKGIVVRLTAGGITQFEQHRSERGKVPAGWEGTGKTWDDVPGTGLHDAVYLGSSALANGVYSLSIHETMHSIDLAVGLSRKSEKLAALYKDALAASYDDTDSLERYRRLNRREFIATAVDEYYCSEASRATLRKHYPQVYRYIETELDAELDGLKRKVNWWPWP